MKVLNYIIYFLLISASFSDDDCSNLKGEYACNRDQREYPTEWD